MLHVLYKIYTRRYSLERATTRSSGPLLNKIFTNVFLLLAYSCNERYLKIKKKTYREQSIIMFILQVTAQRITTQMSLKS